jgi:hypothetical protein
MDERIVAQVLQRLHEVEIALVETETRIEYSDENEDARRSLSRAQESLKSALEMLDSDFEV